MQDLTGVSIGHRNLEHLGHGGMAVVYKAFDTRLEREDRLCLPATIDESSREVCLIKTDGTGMRCLTEDDAYDDYPAWSPDSQMLAFTSAIDGDEEIFIIATDGTNRQQVTDNTIRDYQPAWAP